MRDRIVAIILMAFYILSGDPHYKKLYMKGGIMMSRNEHHIVHRNNGVWVVKRNGATRASGIITQNKMLLMLVDKSA